MSLTIVFDSTGAEQIPANAQGAAGYVGPWRPDNKYVDYLAICARFPALARRGRVLSIAAQADLVAEYLDIENGDARPEEFPAWHAKMVKRGVFNPGAYANKSTWDEKLSNIIARAGIRNARKWVADWTYHPHIPPGYDLCQFTDRAVPGHDDDASLAYSSAFRPEHHPDPHGLFHAALVWDSANGRWHVASRPGSAEPGGPSRYASVEVQLNPSTGHWRDHPMPWNAPPLGG